MSEDRISKADDKVGDYGPWKLRKDSYGRWRICSDNFTHDVEMILTGDFANDSAFVEYAQDIARRLSIAPSAVEARSNSATWNDFDAAYKAACDTGRIENWQTAALFAQQIRHDMLHSAPSATLRRSDERRCDDKHECVDRDQCEEAGECLWAMGVLHRSDSGAKA